MELEQLFLKEEELPILGNTHKIFFEVPIHPKPLDSTLNINKSIAQRVSSQPAKILFMDNGLVERFSINNEKGGTLYFNKQELNYKSYASTFINFSEKNIKNFQLKGVEAIYLFIHMKISILSAKHYF